MNTGFLKGDKAIWAIIVLLSFFSILAVYSATGTLAYKMDKNASHFLIKQSATLILGLIIVFVVHRVNYARLFNFSQFAFYLGLILLVYTLLFGSNINDGSRWITLPIVHITFQSSDFAKLALFVYIARVLSIKQDVIKDFKKGFLPLAIPVILVCGAIVSENLSTALLLGATCSILFFIGRVNINHILLMVLTGVAIVVLLIGISLMSPNLKIKRAQTWISRVENFSGKSNNGKIKEEPFQVTQAKIAIANGMIWGKGPGKSQQRNFLPHPYSDFIYAIIIEEYGLIGGVFIVFLYLYFLWRSILIFRRCPYAFGAFLAIGLSITLVFQAMLNMAVAVNLVPVTGLTLPMVSMGGSSIFFNSIAFGIILSVSRYVDEMEGKKNNSLLNKTVESNMATA